MKRLLQLSLCLVLFAFALCACDGDEKRDPSQWPMTREELERNAPSENASEVTYRRYCLGCHGSDGHGSDGVTGADLAAADSPLTTRTDEELLSSVRDGKRGKTATMPPHKPVLSDAQIRAVIAYVRQRFQTAAVQPTPAAP